MAGVRSHADDEPLVRPFFLTRGRTEGRLPLDAVVVAVAAIDGGESGPWSGGLAPADASLEVEHRRIVAACSRPLAVAEVAGRLGLPIGVARVLLDDLLRRGLVEVASERPLADEDLLDRLIAGVERL